MANEQVERNFGSQPLLKIMNEFRLKSHDMVEISTEQITHKMVTRAIKGRRLTSNVQYKILRALNRATGNDYSLKDLFNYT